MFRIPSLGMNLNLYTRCTQQQRRTGEAARRRWRRLRRRLQEKGGRKVQDLQAYPKVRQAVFPVMPKNPAMIETMRQARLPGAVDSDLQQVSRLVMAMLERANIGREF